jgi:hypothetical protein
VCAVAWCASLKVNTSFLDVFWVLGIFSNCGYVLKLLGLSKKRYPLATSLPKSSHKCEHNHHFKTPAGLIIAINKQGSCYYQREPILTEKQ